MRPVSTLISLLSALLLVAGWCVPAVHADDGADEGANGGPVLESLDGAPSLQIHAADGTLRNESAGGSLRLGDWWDMPVKAAARVMVRQGVQALIAGGSRVEMREEPGESGGEAVPTVLLGRGDVRALVDPDPGRRLRFLIRTKTAVMGVRGTDFLVEVEPDRALVHTFKGTVDVGRDTAEVREHRAVAIPANRFTIAHAGRAADAPKSFKAPYYLTRFHQKHPRMEGLGKRAAADYGKARARFRKLRPRTSHSHAKLKPGTESPQSPAKSEQPRRKRGERRERLKRRERRERKDQ